MQHPLFDENHRRRFRCNSPKQFGLRIPVEFLSCIGLRIIVLAHRADAPQFEVGRFAVGKGGIVKDAEARETAVNDVAAWISDQAGWTVAGRMESPIEGGDGNREYLLAAKKV